MSEENTEISQELDSKTSSDTITIKKDTLWKYSTFILLAVIVVGGFVFFTGGNGATTGNIVAEDSGNKVPGKTARVDVDISDAPIKGDEDAPVTIVEYSDYECPYCGRAFSETYPLIVKNYVDTGKAKIAFKNFPLSFHPNAQKAAEAALCVREQLDDEGYFEMHDLLFKNQQSLSVANYKKWARTLTGLDGAEFDNCLDSGDMAGKVLEDFQEGQQDGVRGTPGFFVNGKMISGAQPYAVFQQAIEAEL